MTTTIFTFGHSSQQFSTFIETLRAYRITCLADVRSWPFSQWVPHFNRTFLQKNLPIRYVWLGDTLGGRDEDITPAMFRRGIDELLALAATERVCIVCAERDPAKCHRATKIVPALLRRKPHIEVIHL